MSPKVVVFVYPPITERLVKQSAILEDIAFRPIFKINKDTNKLIITEPAVLEPELFNEFARLQMLINEKKANRSNIATSQLIALYYKFKNGFAKNYIKNILGINKLLRIRINDVSKNQNKKYRKLMLDECFQKLKNIAEKNNFKVILASSTYRLVENPNKDFSFDLEYFQNFSNNNQNWFYDLPAKKIKNGAINYLKKKDLHSWDIIDNIYAPDHHHPNAGGYKVIATEIANIIENNKLL